MLAVDFNKIGNIESKVVQFPINRVKKVDNIGKSTKMWCLKDREEIMRVYNIFKNKVESATSIKKETVARRNLTMFVFAIDIGLRGGDFCNLKWSDIFDINWNFKNKVEYVPEKTKRSHKHIELYWNDDSVQALVDWLKWCNKMVKPQELNDYIFTSQKGSKIGEKSWYEIMEKTRKEAGIPQKIGTHGLRKTMANQYIKNSDDKAQALVDISTMFGHSDLRITERYACLEDERIRANKKRTSFIYG